MKKALIILAQIQEPDEIDIDANDFDAVVCADGGLDRAYEYGICPDIIIGDFDSAMMDILRLQEHFDDLANQGNAPIDARNAAEIEQIVLPAEKDMTDSEAAVDLAASKGFNAITLLGGLGKRFDHSMANIAMLAKYAALTTPEGEKYDLTIIDGYNKVRLLLPGDHTISKEGYRYLSLVPYGSKTQGVTISGVKYPLSDAELFNDSSLGVSNEILVETADLSFTEGSLLVIQSK